MPLSPLAGYIVSLITVVVSLVVGLGVLGNETGQLVVSVAGTVVGLVFAVLNQLHVVTLAKLGK